MHVSLIKCFQLTHNWRQMLKENIASKNKGQANVNIIDKIGVI